MIHTEMYPAARRVLVAIAEGGDYDAMSRREAGWLNRNGFIRVTLAGDRAVATPSRAGLGALGVVIPTGLALV